MEYTSVRIPKSIYEEIKHYAESNSEAVWRTLWRAFTYWRTAYLSHYTVNYSMLDKCIWYAFKLSNSVGEFKAGTNKALKYEQLMKTVNEIERRLGIDCSELKTAIEQYMKKRSKANKTTLNETCKYVMHKILMKAVKEEEQKEVQNM